MGSSSTSTTAIKDNYDQDPTDPALGAFIYALNLTSDGTGGGAVLCGDAACAATYPAGTTVTLSATPASGSQFTGWSGACNGASPCSVLIDSGKSVAARFDLVPVNGACGSSNGKTFTVTPSDNLCASGAPVSFSGLDPATFTWSWNCNGVGTGTTASCSAFMEAYTLAVTVGGSGGGTITSDPAGSLPASSCNSGTCTTRYPVNTVVSLLPTPNAVSTFDGWGGACSGTAGCSVTMSAATAVTASFVPAPRAKNMATGTTYGAILDAIVAAGTGAEIRLLDTHFDEAITLGRGLYLRGGSRALFDAWSGVPTEIGWGISVIGGDSRMENMEIVGKMSVRGGSVRVKEVRVR